MAAKNLRVSRGEFLEAGHSVGLASGAVEEFWTVLEDRRGRRSGSFGPANVAFYLGGLVALTAMSVFLGQGWATYGAGFGLLFALLYLVVFAVGAVVLLRRGWRIPGGILATVAVALVPLVMFAAERVAGRGLNDRYGEYHDFYAWVSSSFALMEVVTIVVGLLVLRRVAFGLLLLPVSVAAWFLSMDATELLFGPDPSNTARIGMAAAFGATMIGAGFAFDHHGRRDLGFWPHLFGLLAIQGALAMVVVDHGELGWLVLAASSLGFVVLSVAWQRTTYIVFGGLGLYIWVGHLAFDIFGGSLLFAPVTAAIGGAIMWLGVILTKRRERLRVTLTGVGSPGSEHCDPRGA